MIKRIVLAVAGMLTLALAPEGARAAACATGTTNGYNMRDTNGVTQCVAAILLPDGRIVQLSSPVDQTGAAIGPATATAQATGNNTLSSILTGMATAALQGTANMALGTPADSAYAGSGTASHTAALKGIYGQLGSLLTANGGVADTAYAGTGSASQVAALKGIYAELGTIIGQAAPTSVVGTSIAAGTQVPGFQGVDGGRAIDGVVKGSSADVGGTITTGGTAQTFMAANTTRRGWHLENQSTGALYVNCSATATQDYHSLLIPAGAEYESSTVHTGTGACSIIGPTAGQAFYARQF